MHQPVETMDADGFVEPGYLMGYPARSRPDGKGIWMQRLSLNEEVH